MLGTQRKDKVLKLVQAILIFKLHRSGIWGECKQSPFIDSGLPCQLYPEHKDRRCKFSPLITFLAKKGARSIGQLPPCEDSLCSIRLGPTIGGYWRAPLKTCRLSHTLAGWFWETRMAVRSKSDGWRVTAPDSFEFISPKCRRTAPVRLLLHTNGLKCTVV
ncbi:hypothetical protein GWK47_054515 [Chionoecetes opilio]|uniref:Uncharacterized protein n=1 Tax=Chionoecetes opilio TaxID=41210 RepID=A0A8J4Y505_CHIOP|nr:hypothetical protein GWK47_054515 [Chionoecetes opilio]